ncbi:hypothetical protein ACHAP7_002538 [Fusarium lateritium]
MSQNYPPRGGTGAAGGGGDQGHGQESGSSRGHSRRSNRRRGRGRSQRELRERVDFYGNPIESEQQEPVDFYGNPIESEQREPVYQYGTRHLQTDQDAHFRRNMPPNFHNTGRPVTQSWEEDYALFGPWEDEPVRDRHEQPPEQISGYGYRDSQRPPLTPRELYGRNQRGFTPPRQSSSSQRGRPSHHDRPVRVPQVQNGPPGQAPNRTIAYATPNTGGAQVSLPNQIKRSPVDIPYRSNARGQSKNSNSRKRKQISPIVARSNNETPKIKLEDDSSNEDGGRQKIPRKGDQGDGSVGNFRNTKAMTDASTQTTFPSFIAAISLQEQSLKGHPWFKRQELDQYNRVMASLPATSFVMLPETDEEFAAEEAIRAALGQEGIGGRGQVTAETLMLEARARSIAQGEPDPMKVEVNVCGNCKDNSHVVADCNKPQSDGLIHGCALCNAHDHSTWSCEKFPHGYEKKLEQLRELVFKRMNRPPLDGKYWYPLMYSYMQDHPDTEVPGLPWTKEFSQRYHKNKSLQEKLRFQTENNCLRTVDPKTRTWQDAVAHYGDLSKRRKRQVDPKKTI